MNVLQIGIAGLGFGAQLHTPVFQSLPKVRVLAVVDCVPGKARLVAEQYRIPHHYESWKELVSKSEIDAICVVTPPVVQKDLVCAALAADKHVLCEKPMGLTLEEAQEMWRTAEDANLVNTVDFEFRFDPGIIELKRQVEAGAIGEVQRLNAAWFTGGRADPSRPWSWQHESASGGGVLANWGSHIIDYLEWITGIPIIEVSSSSKILVPFRKDAAARQREVTAEDSCDIIGALANGAAINLSFSNCHPFAPGHKIEVFGRRGYLFYSMDRKFQQGLPQVGINNDGRGLRAFKLAVEANESGMDLRTLSFHRLAKHFSRACNGSPDKSLPDFGAGVRVHRVLEAVQQSWQSQQKVAVKGE